MCPQSASSVKGAKSVGGRVIALLLSVELLLAGGNLALVALVPSAAGRAAALLVLAVAASEAAVGLALCVACYRSRGSLDPDLFKDLKG